MVLELAFRLSSYPYFSEGLIGVRIDQKYGYADKIGSLIIEPRFDKVLRFSEGHAAVAVDRKFGYIDKSGEWIIKPRFSEA